MKRYFYLSLALFVVSAAVFPELGYCSVESTLMTIQGRLMGTILPLASILGLVYAAISFASGSANARQHVALAILGSIIGFGAPSIISFIRGMVQ